MYYDLVEGAIYCTISMFFIAVEAWKPLSSINLKSIITLDIVAAIISGIFFGVCGFFLSDLYNDHLLYEQLKGIPVFVRVILFYLLADFGAYWVHRLMHTKIFWSSHRWHHAPKYMYWLSGARGSAIQMFLTTLPVIIAWPLMFDIPSWLYFFMFSEFIFRNHWMHANVSIHSKIIELVFITPAYHRIHHSRDPLHHNKNFAVLFTFWDKLFGTYLDPSSIDNELEFGINERRRLVKMVIGV
ncbi:MAG: sterol desaturase family protein [Pseudomonadales bacterium]|nr:sterol desaturase family protein [Pseudomonadales bacterium]